MNNVLILNGAGLADLAPYKDGHGVTLTLSGIKTECESMCRQLGLVLDFRQTDDPDEMFRWISKDSEAFGGVIINPVGHSRAAIQVFDLYHSAIQKLASLKKPIIEVHLGNVYRQGDDVTGPLLKPVREMGFICGLGKYSYLLALQAIARKLNPGAHAGPA